MITLIEVLGIGSAIRIHLAPASNASSWRLLRKSSDNFSGPTDAAAIVVYSGNNETVILDWTALLNGYEYSYKLYSFVAGEWVASATKAATVAATADPVTVDVRSVVRDRLDAGLQVEVAAGRLFNKENRIQVLTAPPLYSNVAWPIVSVHLESDSAEIRGIGEILGDDEFDIESDTWGDVEGWLSRWTITIVGWSLNPDERIVLSQAIKKIIIGNLPVFDSVGMIQVDFSQRDVEDFERYDAPVYQTYCTLTCLAASLVESRISAISDTLLSVVVT